MKALTTEQHLAVRAFQDGFKHGADPLAGRRRHRVEPATHEHWRRGNEYGRSAIEKATQDYENYLRSQPS